MRDHSGNELRVGDFVRSIYSGLSGSGLLRVAGFFDDDLLVSSFDGQRAFRVTPYAVDLVPSDRFGRRCA